MPSRLVYGFQKLAKLNPEELHKLFTSSGRFHGGLRGALIGGGLGLASSSLDDEGPSLTQPLVGAALGGLTGAGIGHAQGARMAKSPYKRVTFDDGSVHHYLQRPGTFSNELIHAKFPTPRQVWNEDLQQYALSDHYMPFRGSSLLEQLLSHKDVPNPT